MKRHFVKLVLGNKNYKTQVSTADCTYICRRFQGCHQEQAFTFIGLLCCCLFQPDGTSQIDPETPVTDLKEIPWKPMVVIVLELTIPAPNDSSKKQLTYKGLGVEASCRKYFDDLARKLALFYRFKWGQNDEKVYPTFGDVLFAYKNNAWNFICRQKSYAERIDESGFTQVAASFYSFSSSA